MTKVQSSVDFNDLILNNKQKIFAINFHASFAEECKQMNEVFDALSKINKNLTFLSFGDESEFYEIEVVPTFLIIKDKKVLEKLEGAHVEELKKLIEKYDKIGASSSKPSLENSNNDGKISLEEEKLKLNEKLKKLVNSQPMMLFIKGTPQEPRCKFSRELINSLNELDLGYGSFNILSDEKVRQGLKEYSEWPTFPQVYINGEFIGGVDIVKEMIYSGEFLTIAPKEDDLNTKLTKLVNSKETIIFIKGNKQVQKCGFSRQIVQIFNDQGIEYETFDILEDDDVRQGLKEFSSWPTFPQVYHKGEFQGGLDIIKELIESDKNHKLTFE
ncbi:Glutaredoxin 3 [Clydaea vesicula]|uniref:Glutaredoxin 3 n=1 Tax=Clydaea vesicula TaxID=447962 RepID=A0AAD5XVR3_9FUNG|nr:Glutaredoxin 3 [Clydaea vesicula]